MVRRVSGWFALCGLMVIVALLVPVPVSAQGSIAISQDVSLVGGNSRGWHTAEVTGSLTCPANWSARVMIQIYQPKLYARHRWVGTGIGTVPCGDGSLQSIAVTVNAHLNGDFWHPGPAEVGAFLVLFDPAGAPHSTAPLFQQVFLAIKR